MGIDIQKGSGPRYDFRERFRVTDEMVERTVDTSLLEEFSEDGFFSTETLAVLGVEGATQAEQLDAILDASEVILADIERIADISVVPFSRSEVNDEGQVTLQAQQITPKEGANTTEKLSYIPGVAEYYLEVFETIESYARGERDDASLYHADLVKPDQYVFGSVGDEDPKLYMVDIDPEITAAAERVSGVVEVDLNFLTAVIDLAAVSHGTLDGHEQVEHLLETMKESGIVPQYAISNIEYSLRTGESAMRRGGDELAVPVY